jgi:hypothetical protein
MDQWNKYTYVCHTCDALYEITTEPVNIPLDLDVTNITCWCGGKAGQLSVVDATILPINNNPKGNEMDISTASSVLDIADGLKQEMELTYGNRITELENELSGVRQNREYWLSENGRIQSQIIDVIDEINSGNWSDVDDVANTLCEIIDYNPVKEIEFTATIRFTGRMEVPIAEYKDGFDISDALSDAYVDINNGNIIIDQYDIEDAEEC